MKNKIKQRVKLDELRRIALEQCIFEATPFKILQIMEAKSIKELKKLLND